jgi:tellurite resistance protein TehA-like permease
MTGKTFLLLIAVFSFYLSVSGVRMLRLKYKTAQERAPQVFDYVLSGFMAIASLGLITMGVRGLSNNGSAVVYLVFGGLSLTLVGSEFSARKAAETDRKKWLSQHIQRMTAAYIATVTAFSAVNFGKWFPWMPSVVIWLWATVVGTGFIAYNIARYVRGKKPEAVHVRLG